MGILHTANKDRVEVLQVVRDALLSRLTPSDEREGHALLSRFYGRSHRAEAVRERLLHLVGGEDWKSAARLLDNQQRVVLRLGYSESLRGALRQLARALPAGPGRARVHLAEASLLRHHSDYPDAIAAARRAIHETPGDPRSTCEAHLYIADMLLRLTQVDAADAEFRVAQGIGPISRRLRAYFTLTQARLEQARGNTQSAGTNYQLAFEQAQRARAQDLALESIVAWSSLAEPTSGPDVALRVVEDALPGARQAGRMDIVFNLLLVRARAFADTGRSDLAETEMKLMRSEAESLGYLTQLTYTLSGLAAVAIERNRWVEGSSYAKQASALAERLGDDLVLGHTLALNCTAELRQFDQGGDPRMLEEALLHGLRSVEVLGRLHPSDSLVLAHGYLTEAFLLKKQKTEAALHYKAAIDLANELGLGWLRDRVAAEMGSQFEPPDRASARP